MKVAFLHDDPGYVGGAELTMKEFQSHAPNGTIVPLEDAETVVIGNCVSYGPDLIPKLEGKRVIRYFNDMDPHGNPELRDWLLENAHCVFTSHLHADRFPHDTGLPTRKWCVIPPAIDLKAFRPNRQVKRNGSRKGTVALGAWQNPGKGQHLLVEWAEQNEPIDLWGDGAYIPTSGAINYRGPLPPDRVAQTLWGYQNFIHLPTDVEPFGRAVVEAWAAGCVLILNKLIGARYFIEKAPEKLETAARDFWALCA